MNISLIRDKNSDKEVMYNIETGMAFGPVLKGDGAEFLEWYDVYKNEGPINDYADDEIMSFYKAFGEFNHRTLKLKGQNVDFRIGDTGKWDKGGSGVYEIYTYPFLSFDKVYMSIKLFQREAMSFQIDMRFKEVDVLLGGGEVDLGGAVIKLMIEEKG